MKIRLLASNTGYPRSIQSLTSYLINDAVAVDGGSLGLALSAEERYRVRNVVLTHAHLDHIASLPIFISEAFDLLHEPICLFATRESIDCLRKHIFNNQIWPDFEQIRLLTGSGTGLRFVEIRPGVPFRVMDLQFTPVWMNHSIPTVGLAIEEEGSSVVMSSDTYVTDELWHLANRLDALQAIFVDVSFPNELAKLAEGSKHLTPEKLAGELRKVNREVPVYAIHMKSDYKEQIIRQLRALGNENIHIGEIDRNYYFPNA